MFEFDCDKCGGTVLINETFTMKHYSDMLKFEIDNTGGMLSEEVPIFLFYQCMDCNELYKFNFKEAELRLRKSLVKKAAKLKQINLRSKVNPYTIDPDNGLEHCGLCEGIDGEGNCFVDYIKQCPIKDLKNA